MTLSKNEHTIAILLLCPLRAELQALMEAMKSDCAHFEELKIRGMTAVRSGPFIMAQGGHGKAQFASQASFYLSMFPEVSGLLCAGAAGSLSAEIRPFDVVVGTQTIEHDYREKFEASPLPKFLASPNLIEKFPSLIIDVSKNSLNFKIHQGPIASGDEDVVDRTRAQEIHSQTSALSVAWEGAGGARAASFHRKDFLEIRAITDTADGSSVQDFRINLKQAMKHLWLTLREAFPLA